MVLQLLRVRVELDNVSQLEIPRDHEWSMDIAISQTGDVRKEVTFSVDSECEVPNSRGTANLILKVEKNSYATVSIVDLPKDTCNVITASDSEKGTYVPVAAFESRGCEILKWNPTGFYALTTSSGAIFDEVDLSSGEWYEVDPDTNEPVSVVSIQSELIPFKK